MNGCGRLRSVLYCCLLIQLSAAIEDNTESSTLVYPDDQTTATPQIFEIAAFTESSSAALADLATTDYITAPYESTEASIIPVTESAHTTVTTIDNSTDDAAPLTVVCEEPGDLASPTDCNVYYSCPPGEPNSVTTAVRVRCPRKMAFSQELARCSRDISTCREDPFECVSEGSFAEPRSQRSYYRCVKGSNGFHKFHVECALMKSYQPILGKCFIDMDKLNSLTKFVESQPDDEAIINAEVKLIKKAEKLRMKNAKLKEKMAMKLQKELDKKAMKDAKKQMKEKDFV